MRLELAIQIHIHVKKVPAFITYIQAFVTKALILQHMYVCASHDSHKKIRFYNCDTDPARIALTTCKFANMFAIKTGGNAPKCLIFILGEFYFECKQRVTLVLEFRNYPSWVQEVRDTD